LGALFAILSTDSNSASIFGFYDTPYQMFEIKNVLAYAVTSVNFKAKLDETAQK
jgi:hypothetical protein